MLFTCDNVYPAAHHYDVVITVASTGVVFKITFQDRFGILEQTKLLMKFTDERSTITKNMTSPQAFVNASTVCLEIPRSRVPFQRFRVQVALKVRDEVGRFVPNDNSRVYGKHLFLLYMHFFPITFYVYEHAYTKDTCISSLRLISNMCPATSFSQVLSSGSSSQSNWGPCRQC